MAAKESLNLLTDCLICQNQRDNRNPRLLACKHGFCEKCLVDTEALSLEGQIQCPACWLKTPLPHDGVIGLPPDRNVCAATKAITVWKSKATCDLCSYKGENIEACGLCTNCEVKLCNNCLESHQNEKQSTHHLIIEDLCKIHIRNFTHACLTCHVGLCFGCVRSGFHEEHDVCDVIEAKEKASTLLTEKQSVLQHETQEIDKIINRTLDDASHKLVKRRKETEEKMNLYKKKLHDAIETFLDKREDRFHKLTTRSLDKQNQASANAANCLNEMRLIPENCQGKLSICGILLKTDFDMLSAMKGLRIAKSKMITLPTIAEDKCEFKVCNESGVFELRVNFGHINMNTAGICGEKPKKQLNLKKSSATDEDFTQLWSILALEDGSAVLADRSTDYITIHNVYGEEVKRYTGLGVFVRGLAHRMNEMFVGSDNGEIISVVSGDRIRHIQIKPSLYRISGIAVEDGHFIMVDRDISLCKYSLEGEFKEELATGGFYSLSVGEHPDQGKVFIVSDSHECRVHVYKINGEWIRSFGEQGLGDGKIYSVRDTAVLPNGNILVADKIGNKISEFNINGVFVRDLLTYKDDLSSPCGLSISFPYLWIACCDQAMLFKWD